MDENAWDILLKVFDATTPIWESEFVCEKEKY